MITYQYQILRFLPDRVNEEFVNLGVVVFSMEHRFFKARFIDKTARVSAFFPDVNTRYIQKTLRFMQAEFSNLSSQLSGEIPYNKHHDLDEITRSVLPKDDSALIFSPVKKGRDISIEAACKDLYQRIVIKNLSDLDEIELKNDREVWNKVYKNYFEKYNVSNHLRAHTVKTKNDKLEFEKAWKNGKWNCFQTVSFDLVKKDSVKNKVYKWAGKLEELKTSREPVQLYLLSVLPKNDDLKNFVKKKLNNIVLDGSKVKLITEAEAEALARKFKREMEEHVK